MRNVLAALVAVAAVGAVVWFGWTSLSVRTAPREVGPGAPDVLAAFVDAFNAGDDQAMTDLVHPDDRVGLDGLLNATATMRTELDLAGVALILREVDEGESRATASTTVSVTLADLPGPTDTPGDAPATEDGTAAPTDPSPTATAAPSAAPSTTEATRDPTPGAGRDVGSLAWTASIEAIRRRSGWFVQVDRASLHPQLTGTTTFVRREVDTPRASILAADGTPLTVHGDLETLGIEPGQVRDEAVLRERWAEVLPQSVALLDEVLARDDLVPTWFYPVVSLPSADVDAAWSRLRTLPSVIRTTADDPGATATTTTAQHVLGSVGAPGEGALAEELGVAPDAVVGLNGLERVFEDRLVGSETVQVVLETAEGVLVEELGEAQVDPSSPVTTSLDTRIQAAVEAALQGVENQVAVVAVRTDGGIAASASRPLAGYNRAWEGTYPPGDMFMPITAATLVRSGRDLDTPVECPAEASRSGAVATSPRPLSGDVRLRQALAAGCDTSLAILGADLAPESLVDMAAEFGWDEAPTLPLAAATPTFPTPGDTAETVRAAIGQARVETTPLHLATVGAELLSGDRLTPWLVGDDAVDPRRIPIDTSGLVDVARAAAVDGSGATISTRDVGIIVGTAPVTGADTVHSWALMLVDDVGIAVLVEDSGGDLDLVRRIGRRVEAELAARGPAATPNPQPGTTEPTPQPGTTEPSPQPGTTESTPQPGATDSSTAPTEPTPSTTDPPTPTTPVPTPTAVEAPTAAGPRGAPVVGDRIANGRRPTPTSSSPDRGSP